MSPQLSDGGDAADLGPARGDLANPACACVWPPDGDMGPLCRAMCHDSVFHLYDLCFNLIRTESCIHGCDVFLPYPSCY